MNIIDLQSATPAQVDAWLVCLEPWSPDAEEGRPGRRAWYEEMRGRGLLVKLALEDDAPVGMIQCLPIEATSFVGEDLYVILCIWVHGHKKGVGNQQGHGIGSALLTAAEDEARRRGAKGMAAWGLSVPVWMHAGWFRRHGYRRVDRQGASLLMLKAFDPTARAPRWLAPGPPPPTTFGRTTVTCFSSGWCAAQDAVCVRARRAAAAFGKAVVLREIDTRDPAVARTWGHADGLFIDHDEVRTGPPPSEKKLRRLLRRKVEGRWWSRWLRKATKPRDTASTP